MSIIKVGTYPKSLMTGDPRDVEKLEYVIQADYLNNDRQHHRVVSISGNWNIRKDDPNFKILGTLDDMLKEQIPKEVLDLIRELPDLNTIFPKNIWPDMAVINDGLSADDILKVYSVDSLVQMLVRAQLLINHIEPIIEKLKPTKVEEKDTVKPSKRIPSAEKLAGKKVDEPVIVSTGSDFNTKYYMTPDGRISRVSAKSMPEAMPEVSKWEAREFFNEKIGINSVPPPPAYTGTPNPVPGQRFAMTHADLDNMQALVTDAGRFANQDDIIPELSL